MRPLPVTDELVALWNAGDATGLKWDRITMHAPREWSDPALGRCDDVEVLVGRRGAVPVKWVSRIQVSLDDLESMRRTGYYYLALIGPGMQPYSVWTDELEDGSGGGGHAMRAIEDACAVIGATLAGAMNSHVAIDRLSEILAPWSHPPAPEMTS